MNKLKDNMINTIEVLSSQGLSNRAIAKKLGINRKTVDKHIKSLREKAENTDSKRAKVTPGSNSENSKCSKYKEIILTKIEDGLSAQRIYQDLTIDYGFLGSYSSVKRYVRKVSEQSPKRIYRMETQPGEEVQVDYGEAFVLKGEKRLKKAHILRVVLSYSRKGYSEAMHSQNQENFIRGIENAFRHFGGVTKFLNTDNLKSAVKKADWFDPDISPKFSSFCRHYNTVVIPTRPRTPQHKGKVESAVKYVKSNGLKALQFDSLSELNKHLQNWEKTYADRRIHGTTRQQVQSLFESDEKECLGKLPLSLFPCYNEELRSVQRESMIQLNQAYYDVPAEYIGKQVWVRWTNKTVSIHEKLSGDRIKIHSYLAPGKFSNSLGMQGRSPGDQSYPYWFDKLKQIGPYCYEWGISCQKNRTDFTQKLIHGILSFEKTYTSREINDGCRRAIMNSVYTIAGVRNEIENSVEQTFLDLKEEDPVIRDLKEYQDIFERLSN